MQSTTQQSTTPFPRRRNTPANLKIAPPANFSAVAVTEGDTPSPSGPSSESESVSLRSPTKPRSIRNVKRLSLTLQTNSSSNSLNVAIQDQCPVPPSPAPEPRRRPSVVSLPAATTHLRQREDDSPSVPYAEGPIEILPGIWLGSEESARDWLGLVKRGIKSILNVAKEVACPIDASTSKPLRSSVSTSDLSVEPQDSKPIYFPAHIPSGRPGLHYLKLPWSHGQPDLVNVGLPAAFEFVDKSISRGDGILIQSVFFFFTLLAHRSPKLPITIKQLSMWYLTVWNTNYCSRHEGRCPMLDGRAVRGLGTQGYARRIFLRQGKEQMGWSQHVVSYLSSLCTVVRLTNVYPALSISCSTTRER